MKIIDLYNKISNKEIKGGQAFRINFKNGLHRDFYYDDDENNETSCLKNISDDYPLYDDIKLNDEVEKIYEKQDN